MTTFAADIAFGIEKKYKFGGAKRAAKIANLDEFVNNELPNKYHTTLEKEVLGYLAVSDKELE